MPAVTASDGSANLTPGWAHGPPRATDQLRSGAERTIFLTFKDLVEKSVYNSITAVEFLVKKQLDFIIFPGFRWLLFPATVLFSHRDAALHQSQRVAAVLTIYS